MATAGSCRTRTTSVGNQATDHLEPGQDPGQPGQDPGQPGSALQDHRQPGRDPEEPGPDRGQPEGVAEIIANQKAILANQKKLDAVAREPEEAGPDHRQPGADRGQPEEARPGAREPEDDRREPEGKLEQVLANQKTIVANQKKILAKSARWTSSSEPARSRRARCFADLAPAVVIRLAERARAEHARAGGAQDHRRQRVDRRRGLARDRVTGARCLRSLRSARCAGMAARPRPATSLGLVRVIAPQTPALDADRGTPDAWCSVSRSTTCATCSRRIRSRSVRCRLPSPAALLEGTE